MSVSIPGRSSRARLLIVPVVFLATLMVVSCSNSSWRSGELELVEGYDQAATYYQPSRSPVQTEPVETLVAEPDYQGTPLYGSYTLGTGEDNTFSYAIDHMEGSASLFYLDKNNNEDLTDDGDGSWDEISEATNRITTSLMVPFEGGGELPMQFFFYFFNAREPMELGVLYTRSSSRVGEITLSGTTYRIAIVENDNDGVFDMRDAEADTILPGIIGFTIDLNGDGEMSSSSGSPENYRLGEAFNVGGKSYEIADVSPMGDWIEFQLAAEEVEPRLYIEVGYDAPDFSQEDCQGNMIEFREYIKDYKVVLLDFWATWCGPCIAELPHVLAVFEEYKDQGFGVLGVSLDLAPDPENPAEFQKTAEQVRAFMDEMNMDWPTTYDGLYWNNAVSRFYRINSIPAIMLVDSDGKILYMNLRGAALGEAVKAVLEGSGDH